MKIIYKLTAGFLIISLFVGIVAYFGISATNSISHSYNSVREQTLPLIEALDDLKFQGMRIVSSTHEFVSIMSENKTESEMSEGEYRKIISGIELYDQSFNRYESLVNEFFPDEKELVEKIRISGQKLKKTSSELIELKKQGVSGSRVQEKLEEFEGAETEFLKEIDEALSHETLEFNKRSENLESAIRNTKNIILGVGFFVFLAAVLTGGYLSNLFSKPITDLRDAADEIAKGNFNIKIENNSNDEIGQLSRSFNKMAVDMQRSLDEHKQAEEMRIQNEKLAYASKAKSEFLATMSHELRTPLNSIIGFSELLKQRTHGELAEKQVHYVDNVLSSSRFLLELINDILDLSKVEAGKIELEIEKISFPEIIDETLILVKERAAKHNVIIKKEVDPRLELIEADRQRVKQVLFNLLSNAVKFSKPEGGTVTITVKKEGGMAVFSVRDTGIGIKEENMGRLFNTFEQLDSSISRKYQGTGLGLAISKKLIELHGGKIMAESKYGEGTTFTFTLPIAARTGLIK